MLVLTRLINESVSIVHKKTGETITVRVCGIRANKARLGFIASRDWNISRDDIKEILDPKPTAAEKALLKLAEMKGIQSDQYNTWSELVDLI